jgi:hypothetical protein
MMRGEELQRWRAKNLRLNATHRLAPGDRLMDRWWCTGVITKVVEPRNPSIEDHGTIYVTLDTGDEEHYAWFNWQEKFRITPGG